MSGRQDKKLRRAQRAAGVETRIERKRRELDARIETAKEAQAALAKRIADRDAFLRSLRSQRAQRAIGVMGLAMGVIR